MRDGAISTADFSEVATTSEADHRLKHGERGNAGRDCGPDDKQSAPVREYYWCCFAYPLLMAHQLGRVAERGTAAAVVTPARCRPGVLPRLSVVRASAAPPDAL
jgi:hypothetical protein